VRLGEGAIASGQARLAAALAAGSAAAYLSIVVLELAMVRASGPADFGPAVLALGLLASAAIGAVILRKTGNTIGWIFLCFGSAGMLWVLSREYLVYSVGVAALPFPTAVAILGNQLANIMLFCLALLCLLFPTGAPPSRRWRWVLWVWASGLLLVTVWTVIRPGVIWSAEGRVPGTILGPLSPPTWAAAAMISIAVACGMIAGFAGIVSLVVRARRATGEERQQIRWLSWIAGAVGVLLVGAMVLELAASLWEPSWAQNVSDVLFVLGALLIVIGMPVAVAVAILRYRLYEIDLVIRKTVVVGVLVAFITTVYVLIVVGLGDLFAHTLALQIAATAIIAIAFQPVRDRANRLANRLVYGHRATPYEVLARFGERVGGTYASEDVLPRVARVIAEGTAASAEVWLHIGDQLRLTARWPAGEHRPPIPFDGAALSSIGGDRVAAVRHQGELLGAIAVSKPLNEPLAPGEAELLDRLAEQAGLVLANARLTADLEARLDQIARHQIDLRASRQRIVAAQDEERRRLERNIHDGAQQHLVALAVKLRLARTALQKDRARGRQMLREISEEIDAALDTLRSLALGIYPPLLEEQGIAPAIAAQYMRSDLPVRMESDGIGRYPIDLEAAVYFCALEALQNAAKYARASAITIGFEERDGALEFRVTDDGVGFDPAVRPAGTGIQGMRDRMAVFGGNAEVESSPGRGTTVRGRVPIGERGAR
jgi:signal transduction histidine kinase